MSPSLNRLRTALWPPAGEVWGLVVGAQEVVACQLLRQENGWLLATVNVEATPETLYRATSDGQMVQRLMPVIAGVAGAAAGRCIPLSVAIPDPAISVAMLELDSLPKTQVDRVALARWQLQKFWPADTDLACIAQDMGMNDNKHYLLASAMPSVWLNGILSACHAAHVVPTFWQSAIVHRFGRFETQLCREGRDGSLLTIDTTSWSLLLWDQSGRVRHLRSRWRDPVSTNEAETIAVEAERTVRAYVHGAPGRRMDAVHFIGDSELANRVVALLEARMQNACVRLSPLAGINTAAGVSLSPDAALAVTAALAGM